jgi:polyphosphate kinase
MGDNSYFNRDLSWLSFNGRVLQEAAGAEVPLMERVRFLSIYSSNLDEFYRVRMPVLMVLSETETYTAAGATINRQLNLFGGILTGRLIPQLKEKGIYLVYNEEVPPEVAEQATAYFFSTIAAFLRIVRLEADEDFFPGNNNLYMAVFLRSGDREEIAILNIPSGEVARFYTVHAGGIRYILFIDDLIKAQLPFLFPGLTVTGAYNIKITRDAELDLRDEYQGDLAGEIEKQLRRRDLGLATRFLYPSGLSFGLLQRLVRHFNLFHANLVAGGTYHNLKDLSGLPVSDRALQYTPWPPLRQGLWRAAVPGAAVSSGVFSLFDAITRGDRLIHPPYHSYDPVLRFFNEAAIDPTVEEVFVTLYRVASHSLIVHALMTAAANGKQVTVFVELKARFDEENNIRWAKKMKEAGVKIIYSIPGLKVHAKVALVKRRQAGRLQYVGLLSTGNLNESTARFYTDHVLLTARPELLRELELLFIFLPRRRKPDSPELIPFQHLLVSQFNLLRRFTEMIDREIGHAREGQPAAIRIKLNNLEERTLIDKLYEASQAGVEITLVVRGICCLVPGIPGLSERIRVLRIVDRYLEHGRIWIFHNNGAESVYLGSSDWMDRNIYRRIEVCFPLYDPALKNEILRLMDLQTGPSAQESIYQFLQQQNNPV